eukprot:TRINITY_DN31279_c0_g1_i1.p1 TRINITY_DN31279_c0_g1~~TRINITY_DN31279_c0_g1_i1.p1  ORF type:complete len:1602 (-),score=266.71 TRINITY_DN31279_c0_g1_i1:421-5226(-)
MERLVATAAQHFTMSFEYFEDTAETRRYQVYVFLDCDLVLNATVLNPCHDLSSLTLQQPVLGHRRARSNSVTGAGSAGAFTAMYISEIRLWEHSRDQSDLCSTLTTRLQGNETGLVAYAPVRRSDATSTSGGTAERKLSTGRARPADWQNFGFVVDLMFPRPEDGVLVRCADGLSACPDFSSGIGFTLRHAPFEIAPEVLSLVTRRGQEVDVELLGYDPDNYLDHSLSSSLEDAVEFILTDTPEPGCGYLYGHAQKTRILDSKTRQELGLPLQQSISSSMLPLRYVPVDRTSTAEGQDTAEACDTKLTYRVRGTGGLSLHEAEVRLLTVRPGLQVASLRASDPSGSGVGLNGGAGGLLNISFSQKANMASADPDELFQIFNGSWGSASSYSCWWTDDGQTFMVEFDGSTAANLVPGHTYIQVRTAAGLQVAGDDMSDPASATSPTLSGDFVTPTCQPGSTYNFATETCDLCKPGFHWMPAEDVTSTGHRSFKSSSKCVACPPGTIAAAAGALTCTSCPEGQYLPPGANATSCTPAVPGSFVPRQGMTDSEPCQEGSVAEQSGLATCQACPKEANCGVSGLEGALAVAKPGFFRAEDGVFKRCRFPHLCLGNNTCGAHLRYSELGCYTCESGFFREHSALRDAAPCEACEPLATLLRDAAVVAGCTLAFAFFLARISVAAARHKTCLHPFMLKIGISHIFMMNSLVFFEEWEMAGRFSASNVLYPALRILRVWDGAIPSYAVHTECLVVALLEYWQLPVFQNHLPMENTGLNRLWIATVAWLLIPLVLVLVALLLSTLLLLLRFPSSFLFGCCTKSTKFNEASDAKFGSVVPVGSDKGSRSPSGARRSSTRSTSSNPLEANGWQCIWSEEHSRYYYHNAEEGESSWTRPAEAGGVQALASRSSVTITRNLSVLGAPEDPDQYRENDPLEARYFGIWRLSNFERPWIWRRFDAVLEDSLGIAVAILVLSYPAVLRQLMVLQRCDAVADDLSEVRLLALPEVICGSAEHAKLSYLFWAGLLLWGIGMPVMTILAITRNIEVLAQFQTKVRIGILSAEYEVGYCHWEALVFLRRLAVVAASSLAPGMPHALRLVLLLALGLTAALAQCVAEPFDNRSGLLLDVLEAQALKLFCGMTAIMLIGFCDVLPPAVSACLVGLGLLAHLGFLAEVLVLFLGQMLRDTAETVVDLEVLRELQKPPHPCFCWQRLRRWCALQVFKLELRLRQKRAFVTYVPGDKAIVITPGRAGKAVTPQEQLFVAHGMADLIHYAVTELNVERLSVHYCEYLFRQAFADTSERLRCADDLRQRLGVVAASAKPEESEDTGGDGKVLPWHQLPSPHSGSIGGLQDTTRRRLQRCEPAPSATLFHSKTFAHGMLASDFQGALLGMMLYTKEHANMAFKKFLARKGIELESTAEGTVAARFLNTASEAEPFSPMTPSPNARLDGSPSAAAEEEAFLEDLELPAPHAMHAKRAAALAESSAAAGEETTEVSKAPVETDAAPAKAQSDEQEPAEDSRGELVQQLPGAVAEEPLAEAPRPPSDEFRPVVEVPQVEHPHSASPARIPAEARLAGGKERSREESLGWAMKPHPSPDPGAAEMTGVTVEK